jgi:hypothetical protein
MHKRTVRHIKAWPVPSLIWPIKGIKLEGEYLGGRVAAPFPKEI